MTLDDEEDSELSEVLGQLSGSPLSESLLERRRILEQQLASSENQQPKEMVKAEESKAKPSETRVFNFLKTCLASLLRSACQIRQNFCKFVK